ncbi:MAG TPA: type II secretion system F family protein [Nevskiaceae bacterium]|nr:type II secretion system F family protein [Nevskiaceae bacterium]
MEKFDYKAKNKDGQTKKGVVEARNQKQAANVLRERGFWVISIKPKGQGAFAELKGGFFKRVKETDKVNFTRQLATMIKAGLPITDALSILEYQSNPAMGAVVGEILREIEGGGSLTAALEKQPNVFDQIYIALVRAGEAAGVLDEVLERLADNLEKQREFNNKIKGAMLYPAIVTFGMIAVAAVMVIFVIPQMTSIYEEFQADLPAATKMLMKISELATSFWWLGLLMIIGLVIGGRVLAKKPEFRQYWDQFLFRVPLLGKLRRNVLLTEFARTLGLLIGSGVLVVEALSIVQRSLKSSIFLNAVKNASKDVERGLPLATALARTEVFPPLMSQMIAVGEETGKIDDILVKVASYFQQEADTMVKGLTTALEPIILVVMGVGVAFLMISIIMPIYSLTSQF